MLYLDGQAVRLERWFATLTGKKPVRKARLEM